MSQTCRSITKRLAAAQLGLPCSSGALSIFIATAGVLMSARSGLAQAYPTCQPPRSDEYLVLVVSQSADAQAKVRSTLSNNADSTICNYFQDTVTRVGGFRSAESATSWANYFSGTVGLSAFVARPSTGGAINAQQPWGTPPSGYSGDSSATSTYNPQLLGGGYAVIVQYYNRPEVAAQVSQTLNRQIGLASYGQRPFLLAAHTTDQRIADSIVRSLSERGFTATVVDSRQVVLLKPSVSVSGIGGS